LANLGAQTDVCHCEQFVTLQQQRQVALQIPVIVRSETGGVEKNAFFCLSCPEPGFSATLFSRGGVEKNATVLDRGLPV
jgi:hypothetical protein